MAYGKRKICILLNKIFDRIERYKYSIKLNALKSQLGHIDPNVNFGLPDVCVCPQKIFIYGNSNIYRYSKFIISPIGASGRFIMKKESGAAQGLTVVTGNHTTSPSIGKWHKENTLKREGDIDKDVIVEEDVWIGANVTLLSGVIIGRGSIVGGGSVVRTKVPPYSIVMGNPAKVIGFKFTPEEIIQHELSLYPEKERLPLNLLEKNYQKYYLKRVRSIKEIIS